MFDKGIFDGISVLFVCFDTYIYNDNHHSYTCDIRVVFILGSYSFEPYSLNNYFKGLIITFYGLLYNLCFQLKLHLIKYIHFLKLKFQLLFNNNNVILLVLAPGTQRLILLSTNYLPLLPSLAHLYCVFTIQLMFTYVAYCYREYDSEGGSYVLKLKSISRYLLLRKVSMVNSEGVIGLYVICDRRLLRTGNYENVWFIHCSAHVVNYSLIKMTYFIYFNYNKASLMLTLVNVTPYFYVICYWRYYYKNG